MRVLIACLLLLASCQNDGPTAGSDDSSSFTPADGVLRAAAVQANPGDEATLVVTGAKLTALRAAWFKLANPGDADSVPAHVALSATQDSATVTVLAPDHGGNWDLFLAFPAATRRLVGPLRVAGPLLPPDTTSGLPGTITLDSAPVSIAVPPGLATRVQLTGHGLDQVVSAALVASGTTTSGDAAVTLLDVSETAFGLTVMLHPTAVPGSAYDLVVTAGGVGRTVTLTKPRFVVVGAAYPSMVMEFPAGSDSLHLFNPVSGNPWLCPNQYYASAYLCGVYVVRLPASGDLTIRLTWRDSDDPEEGFYGRLAVDPPGHISQSFKSPVTMVIHGSAGDLIRIAADGFFGSGALDLFFAPQP